jgi:hypothetical protein
LEHQPYTVAVRPNLQSRKWLPNDTIRRQGWPQISECAPSSHTATSVSATLRRTGQREQAQEHLTTATTMYREMGMTYWLEKAEAEMKKIA